MAHSGHSKLQAETPAPANAHAHVPALDGVRGIAILLVMFYHFANSMVVFGVISPLLQPFRLGWYGVDVFFALSGFLITGILLDTKTSTHYFRSFYARRGLRILPLYYGAILVVFLLRAAFPNAGVWGSHDTFWGPGSLLWPSLYLQNIAVYQGDAKIGLTAHYWSLAVEEHFYLVWPLVIWLARTRRQILSIAAAAITISIVGRVALWLHGSDLSHAFGLTPFRMDGLAIGAAAAVLVRGSAATRVMRWAATLSVVPLVLLCVLVLARHTLEQTDGVVWIVAYPLVAICTAQAIVLSLARGRTASFLSLGVFRWFGKYSFGLYVWHPILNAILFHSNLSLVTPASSRAKLAGVATFVFAFDLIVAWLSFHLFEKRFLALKRYFTPDLSPEAIRATVVDEALPNAASSPAS